MPHLDTQAIAHQYVRHHSWCLEINPLFNLLPCLSRTIAGGFWGALLAAGLWVVRFSPGWLLRKRMTAQNLANNIRRGNKDGHQMWCTARSWGGSNCTGTGLACRTGVSRAKLAADSAHDILSVPPSVIGSVSHICRYSDQLFASHFWHSSESFAADSCMILQPDPGHNWFVASHHLWCPLLGVLRRAAERNSFAQACSLVRRWKRIPSAQINRDHLYKWVVLPNDLAPYVVASSSKQRRSRRTHRKLLRWYPQFPTD